MCEYVISISKGSKQDDEDIFKTIICFLIYLDFIKIKIKKNDF